MSIATPKTDFIELLGNLLDHLEVYEVYAYNEQDKARQDLIERVRTALTELEEL